MTTTAPATPSAPASPGGAPLISASNVTVQFGGVRALADVSIEVAPNAITGLVGPNGAGKTTLFGVLSGLLRPDTGRVSLLGADVTGLSPQGRARRGMARTFQQPELFMGLTVREHLVLADRVRHQRARLWKDVFTGASLRRPDRAEAERVDGILNLLSLEGMATQVADTLPLGTSRLVEVARAMATSPKVILLDEPLAGLDVVEAERLARALRRTVDQGGVSLLLVEHDVGMVLSLSKHIYVLDFGVLIAEGNPDQIRTNPEVKAAYLGDEEAVTASRTSHDEGQEHA